MKHFFSPGAQKQKHIQKALKQKIDKNGKYLSEKLSHVTCGGLVKALGVKTDAVCGEKESSDGKLNQKSYWL